MVVKAGFRMYILKLFFLMPDARGLMPCFSSRAILHSHYAANLRRTIFRQRISSFRKKNVMNDLITVSQFETHEVIILGNLESAGTRI